MYAVSVAIASRRYMTRRKREALWGYVFASSWILNFMLFSLFPFVFAIYLSFCYFQGLGTIRWIGLYNYQKMFRDPMVAHSLWVTFKYTLMSVPINMVSGVAMAVLLNQKVRGLGVWRTIYYLPAVLPQIAALMLWGWIFSHHGILNWFLSLFGFKAVDWLTNEYTVLPAFIIMNLWYVGSGVLIYLAAMQNVPTEFYEAAQIDGANAWQRFWHITIPQISPILFMQLIFNIIGSLQTFSQVIVMIGNNPNPGALFFSFYVYQQFFLSNQYGYAAALSWLLFAIIAVITALTFKWSQAWVYYEGMRTKGR